MFISGRKFKKGFTLIELLVVISIFVILTGVVLFNQSSFNSTILLTNLAYDTALTIRQAQTYGINIKNFNNGSDNFVPYGVHFDFRANKSFILFADLKYDGSQPDVFHPYEGLPSLCELNMGCVNRYNITKGNSIKDICLYRLGNESTPDCLSSNNFAVKTADIIFVRPEPNANIIESGNTSTSFNRIEILLVGQDGVNTRKVTVQSNGLIQITH